MSSPITCNISSSSGRGRDVRCRPKKRPGHFNEDQENIDPTVDVLAANKKSATANRSAAVDKSGIVGRSLVSKKHCSKATNSATKRKTTSTDDLLAPKCDRDREQTEDYMALISNVAATSQRYGNGKALSDATAKFALSRSEDRLYGLIGDFSRPYALPFIESDKHRDLRAISCHTVCSSYFMLHYMRSYCAFCFVHCFM